MVSFVPGYYFHWRECCLGPRVSTEDTEYEIKDNLVIRFIPSMLGGYNTRSLVAGYQNFEGKYCLHL
jgi:hypothetical protein